MPNNNHYVFSQEVIDMVTVSVQTCLILEHASEYEKADFIDKMVRLLPLLYLKTIVLDNEPNQFDGYLQNFVTEDDYNYVAQNVRDLLGNDDAYLEVFMSDMQYSDTPITTFISENLADIYQELKDLAGNFQTGNEAVMEEALSAVLDSFRTHWGQKLLNALRALHACKVESRD